MAITGKYLEHCIDMRFPYSFSHPKHIRLVGEPTAVMLEDLQERGVESRSRKSYGHNRQTVQITRRWLGRHETANQIQAA
jgi:hypothetical protein